MSPHEHIFLERLIWLTTFGTTLATTLIARVRGFLTLRGEIVGLGMAAMLASIGCASLNGISHDANVRTQVACTERIGYGFSSAAMVLSIASKMILRAQWTQPNRMLVAGMAVVFPLICAVIMAVEYYR